MLKFNEKFGIEADDYNIMVVEKKFRKKKNSEETYSVNIVAGYFGTLDKALDYILQRNVREGISEGLTQLTKRLAKFEKELQEFKQYKGKDFGKV